MKNNSTKIMLGFSVLLLILLSLAAFFLYRTIDGKNQKAEENTTSWQLEARRRDDIKSLDRSLQKIDSDRVQLETHFAKSSDIVPFLDTMEKLAPTVGATAQVDSVNTAANNSGLVVGLKATGSFDAVYKFLTLLENSPYELEFLSMDMHNTEVATTGKGAKSSKWEIVFKIQLLSFTQ